MWRVHGGFIAAEPGANRYVPALRRRRGLPKLRNLAERSRCRRELQSRYLYWQVAICLHGDRIAGCWAPIYKDGGRRPSSQLHSGSH
jgi:hypothetical protein